MLASSRASLGVAVVVCAAYLLSLVSAGTDLPPCTVPTCTEVNVLSSTAFPLSEVGYYLSEDFQFGSPLDNAAGRRARTYKRAPKPVKAQKGPVGAAPSASKDGPSGAAASAPVPASSSTPASKPTSAPAPAPASASASAFAPATDSAPAPAETQQQSATVDTGPAGNATLENTYTATFPIGLNGFPTDCCRSFFNVLSAVSWASDDAQYTSGINCVSRITSITFYYYDQNRKYRVTFEARSSSDSTTLPFSAADTYGPMTFYSFNTAASAPHPFIPANSNVGIENFVMGGVQYNVNQIVRLKPYVYQPDGSGYAKCIRVRHHSFYVAGHIDSYPNDPFYLEVIVQESTAPY